MAKNKLKRFAAVKDFENFFEPVINEAFPLKGKWREKHFENSNPLILELGCGKGEYTVGLARHYPQQNFIGVDIKGSRMFVGAEEALNEELRNAAFLRTRIDFIENYFGTAEVDEIWLTFSDPQPKKPNKRLSSPAFIERYRKILKPGGIIHLKTDSDLLFEFTENEIKRNAYEKLELTWDLYSELANNQEQQASEIFHIKTHYEKLFSGRGAVIKYCKFRVN